MATNANWTVVFEDKLIIKQGSESYKIDNDTFWNDNKWNNIWAIQYKDDDHDYNDSVEYRDNTPHTSWSNANLGDFRTQFIDKWDIQHLINLQSKWDNNNINTYDENGNETYIETEDEKITRLGARPESYSS
jgi:hypothetical protein